MNRTQLPLPPDPSEAAYSGNPQAWQRAAYQWMQQAKLRLETDSTVNVRPVTPFQLGTYTATNTLTGTDATSNFVATLVAAMTTKGLVGPTQQGET
jgi:hypothetical protein